MMNEIMKEIMKQSDCVTELLRLCAIAGRKSEGRRYTSWNNIQLPE